MRLKNIATANFNNSGGVEPMKLWRALQLLTILWSSCLRITPAAKPTLPIIHFMIELFFKFEAWE